MSNVLTQSTVDRQAHARSKMAVIDADIHNAPASLSTLAPYLSTRWQRHLDTFGLRGNFSGGYYPRLHPNAARTDAWPPSGGSPGSDLAFMQEQLLDAWDLEYGVLNCLYGVGGLRNLDYAAALARAVNEWQVVEWLEPEPRLRASIVVAVEEPAETVAEIERYADDARFVQILLAVRTHQPMGQRKYWPIYEAAAAHGLPIGIHFGGNGGWPITGAGWPSFYIEDHVGMPQSFQPQITSMIFEGIFERFPDLKIVLIEGGFAWLPALMWRLDRAWRELGEEVPHVVKPPSETLREHFWITTQPIEEPPQELYFRQLLDQLQMNDRFIFATDYPHWDFDAPDQSLPNSLSPALKKAIFADNARALYRF